MASTGSNPIRQFYRILERLNSYESGDISLRVLIADLEVLIETLASVQEKMSQELREYWAVLEEVYSVCVDNQAQEMDKTLESQIHNAVTTMRRRVQELFEKALLEHGDDEPLD